MGDCSCKDDHCTKCEMVDELLGLYKEFGASDYIGEMVTQIQHALQAADGAETEQYSNEVKGEHLALNMVPAPRVKFLLYQILKKTLS